MDNDYTTLVRSTVVPDFRVDAQDRADYFQARIKFINVSEQGIPSVVEESHPGGMALVKQALRTRAIPAKSLDILMAFLCESSLRQYQMALKRWWTFNQQEKPDPLASSVEQILIFLTKKFDKGASYGTLNSFFSVIALLYGPELGVDARVKRFFKGVSKLRSPSSKYDYSWDAGVVLNEFRKWSQNDKHHFEILTRKLVMLLALTTGHCMQTLALIDIRNIVTREDRLEIKIVKRIKTSAVNRAQPFLVLLFYTLGSLICLANTILQYIERTRDLRIMENRLFVSTKKLHKAVSTETLSRWIKNTLQDNGTDISYFKAYSTRHAATSSAERDGTRVEMR